MIYDTHIGMNLWRLINTAMNDHSGVIFSIRSSAAGLVEKKSIFSIFVIGAALMDTLGVSY